MLDCQKSSILKYGHLKALPTDLFTKLHCVGEACFSLVTYLIHIYFNNAHPWSFGWAYCGVVQH